jgi:hypothetical protein
MEQTAGASLSSVGLIARFRTRDTQSSSGMTLASAERIAPDHPQLPPVLETVLTWFSPPQNIKALFRSEGHYHMDRSFSVWK